jgi:hypothetical protein
VPVVWLILGLYLLLLLSRWHVGGLVIFWIVRVTADVVVKPLGLEQNRTVGLTLEVPDFFSVHKFSQATPSHPYVLGGITQMEHTTNACAILLPNNMASSRTTCFIVSRVCHSSPRCIWQELKTLARFHLLALIRNATTIHVCRCIHIHPQLVTQTSLNFCDGVPGQVHVSVVGSIDNIHIAATPRTLQAIPTPVSLAFVKELKHLPGFDLRVPASDQFAVQENAYVD